MKLITTVLPFVLALSLAACSEEDDAQDLSYRYDLKESNGRIVRIDRKLGELVIVEGDSVRRLDNSYISSMSLRQESLGNATKIEKTYISGTDEKIWYRGSYKWRDGKLMYRLDLGDYSEAFRKSFGTSSITLFFSDSDGFPVVSCVVKLSTASRTVDAAGETLHFNFSGSVSCSEKEFKEIEFVVERWSFSSEFRAALEAHE